jgi:hypothetical protein
MNYQNRFSETNVKNFLENTSKFKATEMNLLGWFACYYKLKLTEIKPLVPRTKIMHHVTSTLNSRADQTIHHVH